VECPGGHSIKNTSRDEGILLKPGYMSVFGDPLTVYSCVNTELRCPGIRRAYDFEGMCAHGFNSRPPQCAVCKNGYYAKGDKCHLCKDSGPGTLGSKMILLVKIIGAVLFQFILMLDVFAMESTQSSNTDNSCLCDYLCADNSEITATSRVLASRSALNLAVVQAYFSRWISRYLPVTRRLRC